MRIIPISLPTPFYIGPVNVYLIAEDPVTLIDTGPKTRECLDALREGLRRARFRVADIKRIVLTHAHEDHCGLAKSLRDEAKDAEVLVHGWETGHRAGRLEYGEHRELLRRAGVPPREIEEMRRMYLTKDGRVFTVQNIRGLDDKTPLPRVQHTPAAAGGPSAAEGNGATAARSFITPAPMTKTPAALVGGLGLLLLFRGWHRKK